jgi:hypothetical protein
MVKSGLTVLLRLAKKTILVISSKRLSVVLVGLFALIASATMGYFHGIPQPQIHDEFSYLLAADTFAHGRLTNPTHPMWVHFETLHVIHQPSYMSKFMPAQGVMLMVGRVLGGHPIVGVWLSMACMCAAICWMLQGWLPTRWALLGGIFAVIHPNIGVSNYWAQSYWGGALTATGGALLLGGVRYLMGSHRPRYAVAAGLGLAILANSRPYEGLFLSLPVGLGLLTWMCGKQRPPPGVMLRSILLPFALVGMITVGAMAYYNHRITGNVTQLPYLLHEQQYRVSPLFIWQSFPPKPIFRHKLIEEFHSYFELPYYLQKQNFWGFFSTNFLAVANHIIGVGSVFAIALLGSAKQLLAWVWNDYWGRFALFIYGFFTFGIMIETYLLPHYWAPVTALSYLFVMQGLRLWWARDRRAGQAVVVALPLLALIVAAMTPVYLVAMHNEFTPARQRAELLRQLSGSESRHLILVKYGPNHLYDHEWVYNEADIDGSKVIWARAMEITEDCKLVEYFNDRKVWSLTIDHDQSPVKIDPFPTASCR